MLAQLGPSVSSDVGLTPPASSPTPPCSLRLLPRTDDTLTVFALRLPACPSPAVAKQRDFSVWRLLFRFPSSHKGRLSVPDGESAGQGSLWARCRDLTPRRDAHRRQSLSRAIVSFGIIGLANTCSQLLSHAGAAAPRVSDGPSTPPSASPRLYPTAYVNCPYRASHWCHYLSLVPELPFNAPDVGV